MASITIRNLDEVVKYRLRIQAAEHGRSMEEEAREILRLAMSHPAPPANLSAAIRSRIAPLGGFDLPPTERQPMRDAPDFLGGVG
jgi:plasmid stability protein